MGIFIPRDEFFVVVFLIQGKSGSLYSKWVKNIHLTASRDFLSLLLQLRAANTFANRAHPVSKH